MSDERVRMPSASGAGRYDLCRASFLMEQSVPREDDGDTTAADKGTRIHARLAGEAVTLAADEEAIAEKALTLESKAISDYFGKIPENIIREERFWFRDPETLARLWSGKPDVVALQGNRGMILDYKTLWGHHTPAPSNMQLRTLAVLVALEFDLHEVRVALAQPNKYPGLTIADYGPEDLVRAQSEVAALMDDVKRPGHRRTPHPDACKWCRARGVCPEALATVSAVSTLPREKNEIALPPEAIALFLERAPMVESIIEAVRGKARRLLEANPNAIPGWHLRPGQKRDKITDISKVFVRFLEKGGNQEQFTAAVSVTKTNLLEATRTATGLKGKALNAVMDEILDGCVTTTVTSPSLEKGNPQ